MVPLLFLNIPGDGQALQAAAGKRNQILLQRIEAESVLYFKITHFTARPLGIHEKPVILTVKTGCHTEIFKNSIIKVSKNSGFIGHAHCQIMMGIAPLVVFFLVAVHTFLTADKRGNRLLVDMRYRYTDVFLLYNVKRNGENDNDGRSESGYFPISHCFYLDRITGPPWCDFVWTTLW